MKLFQEAEPQVGDGIDFAADYAEAWNEIKLAEVASRAPDIDKNFIGSLTAIVPRP